MRICLLSRFFDFRGTGVSRIATEVLKRLQAQGHEVQTISTNGKNLYSYFLYTAGEIPLKLPRKNVDVYHALATMESMWLPKDRAIATYLDFFSTTDPNNTGAGMGYSKWKLGVGKRYFELGANIAKRCRYLVCISEKTKQEAIEYFHAPEKKLRVVPLGIADDLEPISDPKMKRNGCFRIGTLGQHDKRKRIDLLVREFRESKLDAELVIGGKGPDTEMLKAIANGDKRIRFDGFVPDSELCSWLGNLDLFVFPTGAEGMGLPLLESFACQRPTMVLKDAAIPLEIKDRCIVVEDLGEVFRNRGMMEGMMKSVDYQGNYWYAKQHTWERCVGEYVKLYEEIAER